MYKSSHTDEKLQRLLQACSKNCRGTGEWKWHILTERTRQRYEIGFCDNCGHHLGHVWWEQWIPLEPEYHSPTSSNTSSAKLLPRRISWRRQLPALVVS